MANLTGTGLANFAKSKLGVPYVYGAKGANGPLTQTQVNSLARSYPNVFTSSYLNKIKTRKYVGKVCCDCSGLISWYTGRVISSAQMHSSAKSRLPITNWRSFPVGTVLWKSGHVGVYIGNGKVVEEKGIDYGCITSDISSTKWVYGLLFNYISYDGVESTETPTYAKGKNPYAEPTTGYLRKGSRGDGVKWLQWELNEAGNNLTVDGIFGTNTQNALLKFQQSAKIERDGVVGPETRKALILN